MISLVGFYNEVAHNTLAASRLVKHEKLNRLIYNTAMNSTEKENNPDFKPWLNVTFHTPGAGFLVMEAKKFIFRPGMLHCLSMTTN